MQCKILGVTDYFNFLNLNQCYIIFSVDDILIYSGSMEEHISHVRQVLTRLLENRLFMKAGGFQRLVRNCSDSWGSPTSTGRFIRDYSKVASPLTRLTSVNVTFCCSPEAHKAFLKLKQLFSSAPVLVQLDPSKQFIVEMDASDAGVRAVLPQYGPKNVCISVPFSLTVYPPHSAITTLVTMSC